MTNIKKNIVSRLRFYMRIYKAIRQITLVDYSIITGGFVQNAVKCGDIDIITVIPCQFNFTRKEIIQLAIEHVEAQQDNDFIPDFQFPIDVLLRQQIIDAINGRTFFVSNGKLEAKQYSDKEIVENPEADYLIWLYEMIMHDFDIIYGNFEMLVGDTIKALQTTFLYAVSKQRYGKIVEIKQLSRDLFSVVGLSYELSEKQCRYLLIMLETNKYGKMDRKGLLHLEHDVINKDIKTLIEVIYSKEVHSAKHCIEWSDLRNACIKK